MGMIYSYQLNNQNMINIQKVINPWHTESLLLTPDATNKLFTWTAKFDSTAVSCIVNSTNYYFRGAGKKAMYWSNGNTTDGINVLYVQDDAGNPFIIWTHNAPTASGITAKAAYISEGDDYTNPTNPVAIAGTSKMTFFWTITKPFYDGSTLDYNTNYVGVRDFITTITDTTNGWTTTDQVDFEITIGNKTYTTPTGHIGSETGAGNAVYHSDANLLVVVAVDKDTGKNVAFGSCPSGGDRYGYGFPADGKMYIMDDITASTGSAASWKLITENTFTRKNKIIKITSGSQVLTIRPSGVGVTDFKNFIASIGGKTNDWTDIGGMKQFEFYIEGKKFTNPKSGFNGVPANGCFMADDGLLILIAYDNDDGKDRMIGTSSGGNDRGWTGAAGANIRISNDTSSATRTNPAAWRDANTQYFTYIIK